MKKLYLALLVAAVAVTGAYSQTLSPSPRIDDSLYAAATYQVAQATTATSNPATTTVKTDAPVTTTTTVRGGGIAADILDWLKVAFGTALAALATGLIYKMMSWFGIQTTQTQRDQLNAIVLNGLNSAAAKASTELRGTNALDVNVKSKIINDAVVYVQSHGKDTIKALGLDANDGQAVEAIRARIETALNDPTVATPAAITPPSGQPLAPKVV